MPRGIYSRALAAPRPLKTHCKYGHAFGTDNFYIRSAPSDKPGRRCKECQSIKDHNYSNRPEARAKRSQRWRDYRAEGRYERQEDARTKVKVALLNGSLVRPEQCSRCDAATPDIEGHHHDYGKPLDVHWLCPKCHRAEHHTERAALSTSEPGEPKEER